MYERMYVPSFTLYRVVNFCVYSCATTDLTKHSYVAYPPEMVAQAGGSSILQSR